MKQTTILTPFETQRRDWCLAGHPVLANAHRDYALIAWAKQTGRLCRIDRKGPWGNPYRLQNSKNDIERGLRVSQYAEWFRTQRDLHTRLDELACKVLLCWCTPESCHGQVLIAWCDPLFSDEYQGETYVELVKLCTSNDKRRARALRYTRAHLDDERTRGYFEQLRLL